MAKPTASATTRRGSDDGRPPGPPEDRGRRLATIPRTGDRGAEVELRVSLDCYEGHPYISARLWQLCSWGDDVGWYPTRKGISIRLSEAEAVADALRQAVRLADALGPRTPRPSPSRPDARRWSAEGLPAARPATGFDEFDRAG